MNAAVPPPVLPMHPAFARGLAQGKRVFVISSDEDLLAQEAADALRAAARAEGFSERHVFVVAGAHFKWDGVLAQGSALSLFSDKQLLEIRVPSGKPGKDGGAALEQLAGQMQAGGDVLALVSLPKLDKTGKNSAWYLALAAAGVAVEIANIERAALPQWLAQRLGLQGQSVKPGPEGERTLQWIADRVEGNLLAAHQEISKLALLYPPGELGYEAVATSVASVARYDVFKLSEAVLSGQVLRTQRMLAGLRAEGEAEVLVHWALSEDIRHLHRLRCALDDGKPLPVAIQQARIWGAKQRAMERLVPRVQAEQTAQLLHAAQISDGIIKGLHSPGWLADSWLALERLALMLCALSAPRPAAS